MMLVTHPEGQVAVGQPAHAWLCGQLARAWGNERFGVVEPYEEVCLAAEQHDVGMAEWDLAPELDPDTGLPVTFTRMALETHLRLWTEGPRRLVSQSRYAALLASMHGSALYGRRAGEPPVKDFLARQRDFQQRLRATLDVIDAQVARNQRLLWTWDGLSLALILDWDPWTAEAVPTADDQPVSVRLGRGAARHLLEPWPFRDLRVRVRTEGRLLTETFADSQSLHAALERAPWVELVYELSPGLSAPE